MSTDLLKIEFYFPPQEHIASKTELVDFIVENIKENGSMEYSGFMDENDLKESISQHIGNGNITTYSKLDDSIKNVIKDQIEATAEKCNSLLPIPTKNFVFVFPFSPTIDDAVFGGTMGVAPYSCVLHVYLSLDKWTPETLSDTIAHELNHTIFYYHHYDEFGHYTLQDEILIEGLAENFREKITNPKISPWASAVERGEVKEILESMRDILLLKDQNTIKGVLFGNSKYKRWTGYSVGYWIAKKFIEDNPNMSWEQIMKTPVSVMIDNFMTKKV